MRYTSRIRPGVACDSKTGRTRYATAVQISVSHMLLGADDFSQQDAQLPPAAPPVEIQHDHDDPELKLICQAIGLDPRELIGKPASQRGTATPL